MTSNSNIPDLRKQAGQKSSSQPVHMFPSDLDSTKFYTKISFREYHRDNPKKANASEQSTGHVLLPIPSTLTDAYGVSFTETDNALTAFADGIWEKMKAAYNNPGESFYNSLSVLGNGFNNAASGTKWVDGSNMKSIAAGALTVMPLGLADSKLGTQISRVFGMVKNPHIAPMFRGMNLRTFELSWRFAPRSTAESKAVLDIVQFIRRRIHPKISSGTSNMVLDYPDQCYVTFVNNKYLENIDKCFIENVTIDRGNERNPNFFDDGAPIVWTVTIKFVEAQINTREDYMGDL